QQRPNHDRSERSSGKVSRLMDVGGGDHLSEEDGVALDLFSTNELDSDSSLGLEWSEDDLDGELSDREGDHERSSAAAPLVALIAVVSAMVAALWLSWVVGHVSDDTYAITGSELLLYRWLHLAIAFTILVTGVV